METIIYCISDIHGCYNEFVSLIEIINLKPDDTLYVLGDAIDRGEEPIKCLELIMSKPNIKMLMGNHELMMVNALLHNKKTASWLNLNGGDVTYKQLQTLPDSEQKAILNFISPLPYYFEAEIQSRKFLLIHAGLYINDSKCNETLAQIISQQDPHDMVWIRKEFYLRKSLLNYTVVFGHTPTICLNPDMSSNIWYDTCHKDKICIDSGCYSGGQLAALRLDDMQEFYVLGKQVPTGSMMSTLFDSN